MTEKLIPEHIDPYRLAEQGVSIHGVANIADMQRLSALTLADQGKVDVQIQLGIDEQGITFLDGSLATHLRLQCQRCMEPFVYEIITRFALGVVKTLDEANALPDSYEPALVTENNLALRELIEDEIILNLPIIPRHEPEDCKMQLPLVNADERANKNPFHVLQALKDKK